MVVGAAAGRPRFSQTRQNQAERRHHGIGDPAAHFFRRAAEHHGIERGIRPVQHQ
jgi:hypothetical protein